MESECEESSNKVRSQLDILIKTLVLPLENPLASAEKVTDDILQRYNIRRTDFDIEKSPDSDSDILFDPLQESKLRRHKIMVKRAKAQDPMYMCVYPKSPEEGLKENWTSNDYASHVYSHLRGWVADFPRSGFFGTSNLERDVGWENICIPNPYILGATGYEIRQPVRKTWVIQNKNEWRVRKDNVPIYPHLILWTPQECDGHEGSLEYAEIASLLTAMHARAFQRKIPKNDLQPEETHEEDGLEKFEKQPERLEAYPFAFKEERRFPVMMVSFLGTDARLLYAYMDAETLVIRQSRLYSFEEPKTAKWDLFARWLLSIPVEDAI